jgi:hypothetical protein
MCSGGWKNWLGISLPMMHTVIIPLVGDRLSHVAKLAEIDTLLASPPARLLVKLICPGGVSPETALAYCDLLGALPLECQTAIISYADLGVPEFALFVAVGPLREMRPSARVFIPHNTGNERGGVVAAESESHFSRGAYQQCLARISRHVSLPDVVGRLLDPHDLADLLILATARTDDLLSLALGADEAIEMEVAR